LYPLQGSFLALCIDPRLDGEGHRFFSEGVYGVLLFVAMLPPGDAPIVSWVYLVYSLLPQWYACPAHVNGLHHRPCIQLPILVLPLLVGPWLLTIGHRACRSTWHSCSAQNIENTSMS
jgi:hypothetical protein